MASMAGSIAAKWSGCLERFAKLGVHGFLRFGLLGAEFTATENLFCAGVEDSGGAKKSSRRNLRLIARPRRVRGCRGAKAGCISASLLSMFREADA